MKHPVWQGDIPLAKTVAIGVVGHHKRGIIGTQKVGAPGTRHARHREIGWQAIGSTDLFGNYRTQARMKADKRSTPDRNAGRGTGHHVVIAGSMIALIMPNGSNQGVLVEDPSKIHHML